MDKHEKQSRVCTNNEKPAEKGRFLWIPGEPTPYTLALGLALRECSPWQIKALFMRKNHTQPWNLEIEPIWGLVLPKNHLAAMWQILAELRSNQVAGVMLDGWSGLVPLAGFIFCRLLRIPVCLTSDTQLDPKKPPWKRLAKALWYPILFHLPDLFLVAGKRQAAMVRSYGVSDERIKVFGLTVDVRTIRNRIQQLHPRRGVLRKRFGLESGDKVVLYVGRLYEYKGIGDLIDSFMATADKFPTAKMLVVGGGALEAAVTAAAKKDGRIHFLGRLDFNGVMEVLSIADLAIVPSRNEAWGLVVIEALAAGLPVIATQRVGCVDDLIRGGENGLVVPDQDPTALRWALERFLKDSEQLQYMRRQSQVGLEEWTIERSAERIVAGWRAMVTARGKKKEAL